MNTKTKDIKQVVLENYNLLNNISNINSGGCLYAAYAIYESLKKLNLHKNEDLVIIQFSYSKHQIKNNKDFINGETDTASSSSHFGISVDGGKTAYDSEGLVEEGEYNYYLIIPNKMIEVFCNSSLQGGNWSSNFNRKIEVPKINILLQINLPILEN